jgi:VWFA-related protein
MAVGLAVLAGPQDQRQRPLRHDTAAIIKLVPVRVLDDAGRPVRGLTKADFTLTDNGEIRTITEFEAHESEDRGVPPEASRPAGELAESSRRIFFVLDMQGSDLFGNRDAKEAVLAYVRSHLGPGDKAGVITFGATTGLIVRQYLTSDLSRIESAIRRSIEMPGGSGGLPGGSFAGDVTIMQPGGGATNVVRPVGGAPGSQTEGGESRPHVEVRTLDISPYGHDEEGLSIEPPPGRPAGSDRSKADFDKSMSELATAMRYIPGSKSVVYFSTRVPGPDVGRLLAEANATVFAVNTNSVRPDGPALGRSRKERQGVALREFSASSGGRYFADAKDSRNLAADIERLSGTFYVLGYYINPSWDGRQHTIGVTVGRPDLEVLAQAGYTDPKPFSARTSLEKKLQLFDMLLSDDPVGDEALDFPVRIVHGSATKAATAAVLLKLIVDERTGVPPGQTELYVLVFDAGHKILLAERAELETQAWAQKVLYPYFLASLPPGDYECRVAARDMETGLAVSSRALFSIPAPAASRACSLASPLLLVRSEKPEFVRMSRPSKKGRRPASLLDFCPYLPTRCVPLLGDLPEEAEDLWALLAVTSGADRPDEAGLGLRLIDTSGGGDVAVGWSVSDTRFREPDLTFFLIKINVRGLAPGNYRLDVRAADPASGAVLTAAASFVKR